MGKALNTWREKLEFLQIQEAKAADPEQKFAIAQRIQEARAKIAELEAGEATDPSPIETCIAGTTSDRGGGPSRSGDQAKAPEHFNGLETEVDEGPRSFPATTGPQRDASDPPDQAAMTFRQYVKTYAEVWGWMAGLAAVSGPIFGVFELVTPPAEGAGLLSLVTFLAAFLMPYLLIRGFQFSARTLDRLALGAVLLGSGALLYYLAVVYPEHVYVDTIGGENARTVRTFWAKEDGFSDEAKRKVAELRSAAQSRSESWETNRREIVRGFGIDNVEAVFTPAALDRARRRVFVWFAGACLLIEFGLCSLAAAEGLRSLQRGGQPNAG